MLTQEERKELQEVICKILRKYITCEKAIREYAEDKTEEINLDVFNW